MKKISRRISIGALAGVCLTGLAMTGTAQASYPSVKVQVCNKTDKDRTYEIEGQNQNGAWVRYTRSPVVPRGGCHTADWWWKTNQNVKVSTAPTVWKPFTNPWTSRYFILPADARNGSTRTVAIYW